MQGRLASRARNCQNQNSMLASVTAMTIRSAIAALLLCLAACGGAAEPEPPEPTTDAADPPAAAEPLETEAPELPDETPSSGDLLPMPFRVIWDPWHGDLDGMIERRLIRAVVPFGGYQFYYQDGLPRGASYDLLQRLEQHLNDKLGRRNIKVYVVAIPVSRDELIPAVLNGNADIIAGDLTITAERSEQVQFARPMLKGINEVVVTGPGAPVIETLDDLTGQEIVVRNSSSYFEHLQPIMEDFAQRGLDPPVLRAADEILEAEDLLEMVNGGIIHVTVMDDYKAHFWAGVFPNIDVRDDLVINEGGSIAWAMRKDNPQLAAEMHQFLRKYGKGTLIGNDTYNRYLSNAARVRCTYTRRSPEELDHLISTFRKYGESFNFDWLMLVAQGQQESGLRQNRKSPAGAVGIMQIKPSTAADRNVGVDDISTIDGNVHAGAKYMRFLADRYFSGDEIDDLNQWIFSLAAYNTGPAKIARYRREAAENGYDPNRWFDNVEIIAARRIGRETVTYVSNVFKYYVGYQLTVERTAILAERHGDVLAECVTQPTN
jgi:membrane-bound lytic murein transglycosylase MltF